MANLLYEIGTEEMPAQYMPGILKEYGELAGKTPGSPDSFAPESLRYSPAHGLPGQRSGRPAKRDMTTGSKARP